MFDEILGALAASKEWGLIILLVVSFIVMIRFVMKSLTERDQIAGQREEQMTRVLVDTVSKLASSIDALKGWLERQFDDVGEDLETIKSAQETQSRAIESHDSIIRDHDQRIDSLEHQPKANKEGTETAKRGKIITRSKLSKE